MVVNIIGPLRTPERAADLLFNIIVMRCFLTWEKSMAHMTDDGARPFCAATFDPDDFAGRASAAQEELQKLGCSPYTVHPLRHLARPEDNHKKTPQYVRLFTLIAPKMESL